MTIAPKSRSTEEYIAQLEERIATLESRLMVEHQIRASSPDARLNALLAVCAAMLVTHDLEAVLRVVVERGAQLFSGVTGVLLFLRDPHDGRMSLRATSLGPTPVLVATPGRGLAGRGIIAPRAMLLVGPEVEIALGELGDDQLTTLHTLLGSWPPASVLVAPLRSESDRLGALLCFGGVHGHLFHPRDLPFVQALADLAAAAIRETEQQAHTVALQQDLDRTQSLHAEAEQRLTNAQAQLLQSAKLAAIGELAASVAHEINNPLYAARNSLYLVAQDTPADAPQRPFLDIAQGELGRIARIISRMRDFYRPSQAEVGPTNLNDLLSETVDLVHTHLRHGMVAVQTDMDQELPIVLAHGDQMRQVFLNLMLNACDAMPNGGTLRVATSAANGDGDVSIMISDTGVGIPPEHLPHLFEPFYTTKPNGTGLGLTISAHIVAQHSGSITINSDLGCGTTFHIVLPRMKDDERARET